MLTIPPETRYENGNPALRRRPTIPETSFTSHSHRALVGQCQKSEWGDGNAHVKKESVYWTDFVQGGVV